MGSRRNVKLRLRLLQIVFLLLMLFSLLNRHYILTFSFGISSTIFYLFQKTYKDI